MLLDEEVGLETNKNSTRSGYALLCTLALCSLMFVATLVRAMKWHWVISPNFLLQTLPIFLIASILLGVIFALLSIRRKERPSKMKTVGLVGNGFFFTLLLVMFVSILRDLSRLM